MVKAESAEIITRDKVSASDGSFRAKFLARDAPRVEDAGPERAAGEELAPPDGGWGWLVAFGSFLITSLLPLLGPCFGILFSRYLLELGTSSTTTAWIFNSQCFVWNFFGLIARPLTQEFGWRRVGMVGAMMTSASLIISAFAPTAEFLFFSFTLLSGIGGGTVVSICFTIVPLYFDRKRGLANAMMMAGVCLGQVIGPPLVNFLQIEYGFKGATILMGAILLNACVGAALFHPIEWHQKVKPREASDLQVTEEPLLTRLKRNSSEALDMAHVTSLETAPEGAATPVFAVRKGIKRVRNQSIASLGGSSLGLSTIDLSGITALTSGREDDVAEDSSQEDDETSSSFLKVMLRVCRSTLSDLRALRSPQALIISIGATMCINGYLNFVMMVPFAMQEGGYLLQDAAFCISISAICNLLFRMLVSFLSDWHWFNIRACYMTGFLVISVTMYVFPILTDLRWMMVVMALWGCGVGANMGLYNIVMIKVMGIEKLPSVFGSCCFMVAIGFIIIGPVIGLIRDMSGSYVISMWVPATMLLLAFGLWVVMPKSDKKTKEEEIQANKKP